MLSSTEAPSFAITFGLEIAEVFDGSKKVGEEILERPRAFDFEVAVDEPDRHRGTAATRGP